MKERNASFEVLRIVLMYMIVVGHAIMHGLRRMAFYLLSCLTLTTMSITLQMKHLGEPGHEFLYIKGISNQSVTIFTSIAFFLWFVHKQFTGKIVTLAAKHIAPFILPVYLLHDNRFIRDIVWRHIETSVHEVWFIPYVLGYSLLIFGCGIAISKVIERMLRKCYSLCSVVH